MAVDVELHRFTNAEYEALIASGALYDLRIELLDGLIVDMSPIGPPHNEAVKALMEWFVRNGASVYIQSTTAMADGWMPEPDMIVAPSPPRNERVTTGELVVEVSDSSRSHDLRKATMYALADVPRYWIVDVNRLEVLEHLEPGPEGYGKVRILKEEDVLDPHVDGVPARTVADFLAHARLI